MDANALTDPPVTCSWRVYTALSPGYVPGVGFPDQHLTNYEALQLQLHHVQSQAQAGGRVLAELSETVRRVLKRHKRPGDPRHGHQVRGLWDGDTKHPAGTVCKACRDWDRLRELLDLEGR